jgi:hypothetical protein
LHGNTPVGLGTNAAKNATESKSATEAPDAREFEDEFSVEDEEAMLKAAVEAEKAFASSQQETGAISSDISDTSATDENNMAGEESIAMEMERVDEPTAPAEKAGDES